MSFIIPSLLCVSLSSPPKETGKGPSFSNLSLTLFLATILEQGAKTLYPYAVYLFKHTRTISIYTKEHIRNVAQKRSKSWVISLATSLPKRRSIAEISLAHTRTHTHSLSLSLSNCLFFKLRYLFSAQNYTRRMSNPVIALPPS